MEIVIKIIIGVIGFFIGFWVRYLNAYGKKKGENLAMKEDIETLTEIVESIKVENSKSLEEIKNGLAVERHRESESISLKRQYVSNYLDSVNELMWCGLDAHLVWFNESDSEKALIEIDRLNTLMASVNMNRAKLGLVFEDKVIELVVALSKSLLEMTQFKNNVYHGTYMNFGLIKANKADTPEFLSEKELVEENKVLRSKISVIRDEWERKYMQYWKAIIDDYMRLSVVFRDEFIESRNIKK